MMLFQYQCKHTICILLDNLLIDNQTGCWNYTGYIGNHGYGVIGKRGTVHRLSANLWLNFDLNSELEICHKCDNRKCFNPEHLFVGTQTENVIDMHSKNRQRGPEGTKHFNCRLSPEDVLNIRRIYKNNPKEISEIYGITPNYVHEIIMRRKWKHI